MINTIERPCHQYRIFGVDIIELPSGLHGRDWTIFREANIIGIRVGMSEQERRRALAEALTEMVKPTS
ncbi:hypothetical protein FHU33_3892 [Blastococcus colisei]|uniref:Uncharacterized protein n=1 Tax=Blastococcus colisei TaxID=1564162 RepID=A0A543PJY4_9ACTN|nr:hypothetical protein [Blastococcus colisei]TQN44390.1 hypothetical protein FHU33_3892 [Blastococcus colisei]